MIDNETLVRFLGIIYSREKLKQQSVAERIGISRQYLSDVKNGRYPVTDELISKLIQAFPYLENTNNDVSDDVPKNDSPLDIPSEAVPSIDMTEIEYAGANKNHGIFFRDRNSGKLFISVPHMPYAARGEFPNLADSLEPLSEWGRELYEVDRKANGTYISFDVRGDSMDNGMRKCLQDGDKVLVRELELDNWRTLRAGDHRYWVIVFGSSVLIKEISTFDSETGIITCHSLNPSPEYHDFTLSLDDVRHLYYVIRTKPHDDIYT